MIEAPEEPTGLLLRFDRVERAVHWLNAIAFAILLVTAAALYFQPVGQLFGRRDVVERIHVYTGIALPVPLAAALAGRWGRQLRVDLKRFNRFSRADRDWLRAWSRPRIDRVVIQREIQLGKFNPGQKLNAAFTAGAGLVMLGTGVIMYWYHPWPLVWRTGATFVHDWLALALAVVIAGHLIMAFSDWDALRSMFRGTISRAWARRHAPAWLGEDEGRGSVALVGLAAGSGRPDPTDQAGHRDDGDHVGQHQQE
jgi:formate dehydrogenase subunit gamma